MKARTPDTRKLSRILGAALRPDAPVRRVGELEPRILMAGSAPPVDSPWRWPARMVRFPRHEASLRVSGSLRHLPGHAIERYAIGRQHGQTVAGRRQGE